MTAMNLHAYLQSTDRGEASRIAREVGVSPTMISQYAAGAKMPAPHTAASIERATGGAVMRWDLRDDWREIWPELASRPDAPTEHNEAA
ncbi:uncharacterized protein E1O_01450 [Burkholderiales bacterium GJ-E10]|nr:uncharacterized protein E1O_01450 [Burkholderiales bacterium GJ-E10]